MRLVVRNAELAAPDRRGDVGRVSRIVVLGDVMVDVVARLTARSPWGATRRPGSRSGTAARRRTWRRGWRWRGRAGARSVLAGRIGADDSAGARPPAALRAAGVETRLAVDPERPTGTCVVLVGPDGERTMVPDPGANDRLARGDLPDELLERGRAPARDRLLAAAGGLARRRRRAAIARARERGMTVSVDPSSAALLSPAFLDELDGGRAAAAERGRGGGPDRRGRPGARRPRLAARVPEVVVTLGAGGALWTDGRRRQVLRVPAPRGRRHVVDTTGAGDAFAAGLPRGASGRRRPRGGARRRLPPRRRRGSHARGAPGLGQHRLAPAAAQQARSPASPAAAISASGSAIARIADQHAGQAHQQVAGVARARRRTSRRPRRCPSRRRRRPGPRSRPRSRCAGAGRAAGRAGR